MSGVPKVFHNFLNIFLWSTLVYVKLSAFCRQRERHREEKEVAQVLCVFEEVNKEASVCGLQGWTSVPF
jgi:hypothetical protein